MPNWALDAIETMTLATDIKVFVYLVRHRLYRRNTYSTLQLAIALTIDVRTMRQVLARLRSAGYILSLEDGSHCAAGATSKLNAAQIKTAERAAKAGVIRAAQAQPPRKAPAMNLQIYPAINPKNVVWDSLKSPLNKGIKEIRNASYASSAGEQASRQEHPINPGAQGPDGPAADAALEVLSSPSQVGVEVQATEEPQTPKVGSGEAAPAAPRAADPGDDAPALHLFHGLAGYGFVTTYRTHLARWHEAYTADFLRLAWRLAPTVPGVKVSSVAFVWMLNREREWPEALKAQYERDLTAAADAGKPKVRVQVGDLLRWADGETATVERVDSATAVTDSANDARGYVPLTLIGKGVEVLRS